MATLGSLPADVSAVVVDVTLPPEQAGWLAAVGLEPGVEVRVLRRASFGGPLHVQTDDAGQFAVAAELAAAILVEPRGE